MNVRILAAPTALLVLAACGGGDETPDSNVSPENMVVAATPDSNLGVDNGAMESENAVLPGATAADGQQYATMAAASDLFEIQSSQVALQKTQSQDVRQLAQMLIADHQKSTRDLQAAAQQVQPPITVTPALNPQQQANMEALRTATPADFDQLYLEQQVPAHEQALTLVQDFAQNGDLAPLKQHAATVSGPIRQHLERARQLRQANR